MVWSGTGAEPIDGAATSVEPSAMGATAYDVERPPLSADALTAGDPLIGRRVDHFEVRGLLGQGGMGSVYLAHDLSLERPVAIKVLRRELASNRDLVGRLLLEARAQARLQHPNVVTIYHIGAHEGSPYFAMEYVRGKTLADHLEERGPLPWAEALEYMIQTTRALMNAHARGIVHRDIKPSNLILDGDPAAGSAGAAIKVADFGLAAPLGSAEEQFVGSPFYASPEQIAGKPPTHRSDMYALGITFHELLTGAPPFQAESLRDMMTLHLTAPRPEIAADKAPWRLRHLIIEMIDPDPQKRPWTYEELLGRLEQARPKPALAGGVAARGMALLVDLVLLAISGELLAGALEIPTRVAHQAALVFFAAYYVASHRLWGKTLGKRMLGLRIQGTKRAVSVPGLALRFIVEFWGPLTAAVMINLQIGAATDLESVKSSLETLVGLSELPVVNDSAEALLRTVLVPNLMLAIPWLAGFLFALFDDDRQALHDRAARTRVVYELPRR
jgi:uncharacterized RDD family membrane protein YckC